MENLESQSQKEEKNWAEYMHQIDDLAIRNDWNQLEDLLREDHPVLPTEKEAFNLLAEKLGRTPRVKLDKSGFHVIRAEEEEKDEIRENGR